MKIINNISSATLRIIYGNRNNQICHFFDFYFLHYRITGLLVGRSLRSLSKHWVCLSQKGGGFPPSVFSIPVPSGLVVGRDYRKGSPPFWC